MTSVLRLGVYRERIEKYSGGASANGTNGRRSADSAAANQKEEQGQQQIHSHNSTPQQAQPQQPTTMHKQRNSEDLLTVAMERQAGKHLGIRLTGNIEQKPGIFIADIQEGSVVAHDGRLQKNDRILYINGQDVRDVELSQASALIQVILQFLITFHVVKL